MAISEFLKKIIIVELTGITDGFCIKEGRNLHFGTITLTCTLT
jgi:hypothetical protein